MSRFGEAILIFCVIIITGVIISPVLPKVTCYDWWPIKATTCTVTNK